MNGSFLLDTNIVIAVLAQDPDVHGRLAEAAEVFVSGIVLGELYYGALKSSRVESNLQAVDQFAAANRVLVCDSFTAQQYGQIKNTLRERGRPIPDNDIWIAATTMQHGLTLDIARELEVVRGVFEPSTDTVLDRPAMDWGALA